MTKDRYTLESAIIRDIIHDTKTNWDMSDYEVCKLLNKQDKDLKILKRILFKAWEGLIHEFHGDNLDKEIHAVKVLIENADAESISNYWDKGL